MEGTAAATTPAPALSQDDTLRFRIVRFARIHVIELSFVAFALLFSVFLQFIDSNNLEFFLKCTKELAIGRSPYSLYTLPAPPGLFLPFVPVFGVYVLSGYNLALANFVLKIIHLAALLILAITAAQVAALGRGGEKSTESLRFVLLLSPVLFFVSFVWVEQDVVGLAITFAGLLLVLRGGRSLTAGISYQEVAGFGILAFGVFTYYFPALVIPTLLAYSENRSQFLRRFVSVSVPLIVLAAWFFVHPGWSIASFSSGAPGAVGISVYSTLSVMGSAPFGTPTTLQNQVQPLLVIVLALLEIALPVLFRWRRFSWSVSLAVAMALPFFFLNIWNGDEFVWPLPFLLVALTVAGSGAGRPIYLWLVQLYALPMILIANMYDAPGPGAGSGIFYFGYAQFHDAVAVSLLVPDSMIVTRILQAFLWSALAAVLAVCLLFARDRTPTAPAGVIDATATRATGSSSVTEAATRDEKDHKATRTIRSRWRGVPRGSRWATIFVLAALLGTGLATMLPAPVLTATSSDEFPVSFFADYPVSNGSVTYTVDSSGNAVSIAPNYGNATSLSTPWRTVNFTEPTADEHFSLNLSVGITAPPSFPYNTTVVTYGFAGLNAVAPFIPPSASSLLLPLRSENVAPAGSVVSPQIVGVLPGGSLFNGSSFAQYDAAPLERPGGQVTLLFRWNGIPLTQNVVATLYRGNVSYQVFGLGDVYMVGVKPSLEGNWSYALPRLANRLSWHELTLTNSSNGTLVAIDGIPVALPPVSLHSEMQGASLFVGSVSPDPSEFRAHDFWGSIAGPYNTTVFPVRLGTALWCPVTLSPNNRDPTSCSPFSTAYLWVQHPGQDTTRVGTPFVTYWLNSSVPVFQFGRLSQVGPALTIHLNSMSLTTSRTLFPFVWFVDGVVGAPVVLTLLAATRRTGSGREERLPV